jgi:sulfur-oxidizing protein SoxY
MPFHLLAPRRRWLQRLGAWGMGMSILPSGLTQANTLPPNPRLAPIEESPETAMQKILRGAKSQRGRIEVQLASLAESGNLVPIKIHVPSAMTASDYVREVHILAMRNPKPWAATYEFTPRSGRAEVETKLRLSDTQDILVLARMSDDSWWHESSHVVVSIGACESMELRY